MAEGIIIGVIISIITNNPSWIFMGIILGIYFED
jgi:hypothetical protein